MNKILVILPNNLGDVIMATPLLEGLKAKDPGCSVHYLVENGFEAGIEGNPYCDEIITFPRKEIRDFLLAPRAEKGFDAVREAVGRIAGSGFDVILNLCQHEYISYLVPLMRGKTVAGRYFRREGNHAIDDPWSQYLYAIPFYRRSNRLHAADVYRRIAGVKEHGGACSIRLTPCERAGAAELLAKKNVDAQKKIIVFQPGAAFPSKCWPAEHFVTLGRLLTRSGWQIVISGAPAEAGRARAIQAGIGDGCFSIAGETGFRQSIAVCGATQGCVTGDTATMHAAAGLRVPVYALFGPTSPVETGPYGTGNWVLCGHCPDRPCFRTACDLDRCMRSISPQTVWSCIENRGPLKDPGCDVHLSVIDCSGDFSLTGARAGAQGYIHEPNAWLVQKAFDPGIQPPRFTEGELSAPLRETGEWLAVVEKMKAALERYVSLGENSIGEFEREKRTLARFDGIGRFWTAVLNIRLNSVPLLNPLEGVRQSIEVCRSTLRQLQNLNTHKFPTESP
jgi:ADP-heptose:LPS heptosyltransferase